MPQREHAFEHQQEDKIGVLLINLGTPEAPTARALRRYLGEFLSDTRVVEIARPLWWLILHGIILRFRPSRSAKAYQQVWTDKGSPLLVHTLEQTAGLRQLLESNHGSHIVVDYAMRYGNPSVSQTIDSLCKKGVRKLLVLPLYPQYSATTTASTFDALARDFMQRRWLPELRFITHYHDNPGYIDALKTQIADHWQTHGRPQKLLFSYHGIPRRNLELGDPYYCECHKTSRLVAEALGLDENQYLTTFQSRFGRAEWLQPYTDITLKALPSQGIVDIDVVCPGFSSDCLETLEEIDVENRGYFMAAGGEKFDYIPALNNSDTHLNALAGIVASNLEGWLNPGTDTNRRTALAKALGAEA